MNIIKRNIHLFFESNLEVTTCFLSLLREKVILNNYGVLIVGLLFVIQIFSSFFLCTHMNDMRLYVFKDLLKCKYNPPLRKSKILPKRNLYSYYRRKILNSKNSLNRIDTTKSSSNATNGKLKESSTKKQAIIKKPVGFSLLNKFIPLINNNKNDKDDNNFKKGIKEIDLNDINKKTYN